jgi:hypothetical protein
MKELLGFVEGKISIIEVLKNRENLSETYSLYRDRLVELKEIRDRIKAIIEESNIDYP